MESSIQKEQDQLIIREIINQLGGNKALRMIGATNIHYSQTEEGLCLSFKTMRNKINAPFVRIILNVMDYYNLEFIRVRKDKVEVIRRDNNCIKIFKQTH